ncbi:MAG: hypothetical protein RMJ98_04060 [Myxococcales bacterium]|nr:hypothetical protein [Polyangiaceae bacterium]MDW8248464.1 hypothetical protein [Myxococcales bacterium]
MLHDLLRRLLWLPPLALLVSALTFTLVSPEVSPTAGSFHHLPRFLNTDPLDAPALARSALARLTNGDDPKAAASLSRLGGATFSVVLPSLHDLPPAARRRVVVALRPVAARMGLTPDTSSPEQEFFWWTQFWEDHALDFRAPVIRRLARRFTANPSAIRRQELRLLDTAALPELFAILGVDGPQPPSGLAELLLPEIQHALARSPVAPEQIPREVVDLREFWFAHRLEFSSLDGAGRATALLLETQYGKWVQRTLLERAPHASRSPAIASSPLRTLLRRGSRTLARVLVASFLAFGVVWGFLGLSCGARFLGKVLAGSLLALVPAGLLLVPASEGAALILLAVALLPGAWGRTASLWERWLERPERLAERARGKVSRVPYGALPLLGWGLVQDFGLAFTVALLIEGCWRLSGLGNLLLTALREQDATLLMASSVASLVVVQVASIAAGVWAPWRDPRREGPP